MTTARITTITGLLVAAVGIVILYVAGVAMPVVPPGLVILLVAAALMAKWRWATLVGVVAALAEAAGFVGSGSLASLTADSFAVAAGTWIRLIGIVVALVAGILATTPRYR
jgi:hypothetical protein